MGNSKQKSLAVLLSLMVKLRDSDIKDAVIEEITSILITCGVCTENEVIGRYVRFEEMISEIESRLTKGVSYKEAYKRVVKKYSEFNNINLN